MFVWLASYPKSGNTWIRLLLNSLRIGGGTVDINAMPFRIPQAAARDLFDEALGLQSSDLTGPEVDRLRPIAYMHEAAASRELLFRKVHDAWRLNNDGRELFPRELTLAAIYIVRDPRDVAVSLAHHTGWSLDKTIDKMNDDATALASPTKALSSQLPQVLFSWRRHVTSWLDESKFSPLVLRYEDMLEDPVACCRAICDRLEWNPGDTAINAAVEQTRFNRLAEQEKAAGFSEAQSPGRPFFRKGKAGGWRNILTASQVRTVEGNQEILMKRLGYL